MIVPVARVARAGWQRDPGRTVLATDVPPVTVAILGTVVVER